jgi:sterol desaturase/sphingolipid hydroxylase (fatty acid hydroxylase superfamily)
MESIVELVTFIGQAAWHTATYFNVPDQRIFWLYLLSSLMIAALLYLAASKKNRRTPGMRGFFDFCLPPEVRSSPSAKLDLRFFFVGQVIYILVFTSLSGVLISIYDATSRAAIDIFSPLEWIRFEGGQPGLLTMLGVALFTALAIDFVMYWAHHLQHRWSFLWEFHKIHHSATVMHPLTNYREHIVDNLIYVPLVIGTSGFIAGVLACWYPDNERLQFVVLGVPLVNFIYNFAGYNLRHSHVWLAWRPWLGRIFGSPANHQIHHSREVRHMNKNFGFIFAVWDWMFGTLYLPQKEREDFSFGLTDGSEPEYSNIFRLYALPFVKLYGKYAQARLTKDT